MCLKCRYCWKKPISNSKRCRNRGTKRHKGISFKRKWNRDRISIFKRKVKPCFSILHCRNADEGIDIAERLIEFGGLGHSAVIHSEDEQTILKFSEKVKVGRIIVNSPSTHGAIGDIYNTNMPSLTLGCGTFGGNSTTANVSSVNLINIKRVAKEE